MKTATLGLLLALCLSACSRKNEDIDTISSREFSLAPGDVVNATIETTSADPGAPPPQGMTILHLEFSRAKADEFRRFTRDHVGQKVQIMIGINVIKDPVVQSEIVSPKLDLPYSTPAEAQAILNLLGKK